ncbi:hypothetical protein LH739_000360 [Salmonella enterica]|nr:hypothetical protein [Salmonella enterica]
MLINNKRTKTGKAENKQGTHMHIVYSKHGRFLGTVNVPVSLSQSMLKVAMTEPTLTEEKDRHEGVYSILHSGAQKYDGAYIRIVSNKRPGDMAFFRLGELKAVKPTGMRLIATLLVVGNVYLYPCIYYNDFMEFINDVYTREKGVKSGEHRVYTLNIDNKKPLKRKKQETIFCKTLL